MLQDFPRIEVIELEGLSEGVPMAERATGQVRAWLPSARLSAGSCMGLSSGGVAEN